MTVGTFTGPGQAAPYLRSLLPPPFSPVEGEEDELEQEPTSESVSESSCDSGVACDDLRFDLLCCALNVDCVAETKDRSSSAITPGCVNPERLDAAVKVLAASVVRTGIPDRSKLIDVSGAVFDQLPHLSPFPSRHATAERRAMTYFLIFCAARST